MAAGVSAAVTTAGPVVHGSWLMAHGHWQFFYSLPDFRRMSFDSLPIPSCSSR